MSDILAILVIACVVLGVCFSVTLKSLTRKSNELCLSEARWVRYQMVIRWCAIHPLDPMDLDAFINFKKTRNMLLWEAKNNFSDTNIIENFQKYVRSGWGLL